MTTCRVEQPVSFFTAEEIASLDKRKIPTHIAIIPDGNRRWAKGHLREMSDGYRFGADTLINIVRAAKEMGVKVLTIFSFSTENWVRPKLEIEAVMHILESYLKDYQQKLLELSIRLNVIGNIDHLPLSLRRVIDDTCKLTASCKEFDLVLALNYGGRDEICRAVKKIVQDCTNGKIKQTELTEEHIANYLDTAKWPDPDLLIRTSGENRLSNFLLWQISYTEIYTEEVVWPDFTPHHLLEATRNYQRRDRRRGGGIL